MSGGQPQQVIFSAVAGYSAEPGTGGLFLAGHFGFGHREALWILNDAEQFDLSSLPEATPGEGGEGGKSGKDWMGAHVFRQGTAFRAGKSLAYGSLRNAWRTRSSVSEGSGWSTRITVQ